MTTGLQRQNLAYQELSAVPLDFAEKTGRHIGELDLTSNRISYAFYQHQSQKFFENSAGRVQIAHDDDLKFLIEYRNLHTLVLDHNQIKSHVKMPDMPTLHTLWLNHNNIDNLSVFISMLAKKCPNLRILSMMNNEAAPSYFNNGTYQQYQDYRHIVISSLPKLETLDDKKVEPNERSEAERIYRSVEEDLRMNLSLLQDFSHLSFWTEHGSNSQPRRVRDWQKEKEKKQELCTGISEFVKLSLYLIQETSELLWYREPINLRL